MGTDRYVLDIEDESGFKFFIQSIVLLADELRRQVGQIEQLYFCEKKKSSSSQDILYRMLGMRTPSVAGLTGVRKSPMCLRRKTAMTAMRKSLRRSLRVLRLWNPR